MSENEATVSNAEVPVRPKGTTGMSHGCQDEGARGGRIPMEDEPGARLAQHLLILALIVGALSGVCLGIWLILLKGQKPFEGGIIPALESVTPNAALVIALGLVVDKMLTATAGVARPGRESEQADAYKMLRGVAPSALAAASAGYLTVAVGNEHGWIILLLVGALVVLGVAIAGVAARLTGGRVSDHVTLPYVAIFIGLPIPLAVLAFGLTVSAGS